MKYKTVGAFRNVQSVSYCKAASDVKIGMSVILDHVAKTAALPVSGGDAKKVIYIVTSINDKPELCNSPEAYVVNRGKYVHVDDLRTVNGLEIEFTVLEINGGTTDLAVENLLVFGTDGRIAKAASADGYVIYFKVICKAPYTDDGTFAEVTAQ